MQGDNRRTPGTPTKLSEMFQLIKARIHSTPNIWRYRYVTSLVHFLSSCVTDWLMKKDCCFLHLTYQQYGCRKFHYPLFATNHLHRSVDQYIKLRYILFQLQYRCCITVTSRILWRRIQSVHSRFQLHSFSMLEDAMWCGESRINCMKSFRHWLFHF